MNRKNAMHAVRAAKGMHIKYAHAVCNVLFCGACNAHCAFAVHYLYLLFVNMLAAKGHRDGTSVPSIGICYNMP